MTSPTEHSLSKLRKEGYTCAIVEHWNPFAKRRQDLFGFLDILGIKDDMPGVLGVQTTSKSNMGARILKIKREPIAKTWLMSGNLIVVDGWEKKAGKYELKRYYVTMDNIDVWE